MCKMQPDCAFVRKNTQYGESECNLRRKGFLHAQNAAGLCVLYAKTPKTDGNLGLRNLGVARVSFKKVGPSEGLISYLE